MNVIGFIFPWVGEAGGRLNRLRKKACSRGNSTKDLPQGLNPMMNLVHYGTTEVVP
jgi:hypothetical protein